MLKSCKTCKTQTQHFKAQSGAWVEWVCTVCRTVYGVVQRSEKENNGDGKTK